MEDIYGIVCIVIISAFIAGMVNPKYVIPFKKIQNRGMVTLIYLLLLLIFANIGSKYSPQNVIISTENKAKGDILSDVVKDKFIPTDSSIISYFKPKFDSLHNKLINLESSDELDIPSTRVKLHNEIKFLLFEQWWGTIEYADSLGNLTSKSKDLYKDCSLIYDKEYAKFVIYGDEDIFEIENQAKLDAEIILNKVCTDPQSLVIENVKVLGKVNNGWKCVVIYRAKNGFGGYVRESITLIMAYNEVDSKYDCIAAK